jgi:Flp pilus assembly pilin Flp
MMTFIKNFRNDEDGAVTVDWVVLTAAIVGLGIAAITAVSQGVNSLGSDIATDLDTTNRIGLGVTATTVGQ